MEATQGVAPGFFVSALVGALSLQAQCSSVLEGTITDPAAAVIPGYWSTGRATTRAGAPSLPSMFKARNMASTR